MGNVEARVIVTGRVQGVGYRAWTQDQATRLGVTGWVRNCPDGTVEAFLQGAEETVHSLLEELHRGPQLAQVNDVNVEFTEEQGPLEEFIIHY